MLSSTQEGTAGREHMSMISSPPLPLPLKNNLLKNLLSLPIHLYPICTINRGSIGVKIVSPHGRLFSITHKHWVVGRERPSLRVYRSRLENLLKTKVTGWQITFRNIFFWHAIAIDLTLRSEKEIINIISTINDGCCGPPPRDRPAEKYYSVCNSLATEIYRRTDRQFSFVYLPLGDGLFFESKISMHSQICIYQTYVGWTVVPIFVNL